jgi:hypothetical protein
MVTGGDATQPLPVTSMSMVSTTRVLVVKRVLDRAEMQTGVRVNDRGCKLVSL